MSNMIEPREPEKFCDCVFCDEPIELNEDAIKYEGEYYHSECFDEAAPSILIKEHGAEKVTVDESMIDDGSDLFYEEYRDEVMFGE